MEKCIELRINNYLNGRGLIKLLSKKPHLVVKMCPTEIREEVKKELSSQNV